MKNIDAVFNEQLLKHKEPEWVSNKRHELFMQFAKAQAPKEREEAWRYTHIEKFDASGILPADFSPSISKNSEIIFTDMKTAMEKHPEIVKKYFLLPNAKNDKI